MDAPNTSTYLLALEDTANLPNSSPLAASGGLAVSYSGPPYPVTVHTIGKLSALNLFGTAGFVNYNTTSQTFVPRSFQAGTGIDIINIDGGDANPIFSVRPNTTVQQVQVQANGLPAEPQRSSTINFVAGQNISITSGEVALPDPHIQVTISSSLSVAPETATYIVQTPDAGLPNAQALDALVPGVGGEIVKVSPAGVLSTAVADTDYQSASTNLTSISSIVPELSTLVMGDGTGFTGFSPGPVAGTVLTSNGLLSPLSWEASEPGYIIDVLGSGVGNITPMVTKTVYVPTNLSTVLFVLPTSPSPGDIFQIVGFGGGGWIVEQNSGQKIQFGNISTATGPSGSIRSINNYDCITIIAITSSQFVAICPSGNPATI